jgi:hypothetical protein
MAPELEPYFVTSRMTTISAGVVAVIDLAAAETTGSNRSCQP